MNYIRLLTLILPRWDYLPIINFNPPSVAYIVVPSMSCLEALPLPTPSFPLPLPLPYSKCLTFTLPPSPTDCTQ